MKNKIKESTKSYSSFLADFRSALDNNVNKISFSYDTNIDLIIITYYFVNIEKSEKVNYEYFLQNYTNMIKPNDVYISFATLIKSVIKLNCPDYIECKVTSSDYISPVFCRIVAIPVTGLDGFITGFIESIGEDITDSNNVLSSTSYNDSSTQEPSTDYTHNLFGNTTNNQLKSLLNRHMNFDSLTKLPTFTKFVSDVEKRVSSTNSFTNFVIAYTDFKNFKYINDVYGYEFGDSILCLFADITRQYQDEANSTLCRIGDDKFISLCTYESIENFTTTMNYANKFITQEIQKKFPLINIMLCTGLYFLRPGDKLSVAIDNANVARKEAKSLPDSGCIVFNESMKEQIIKEAEMLSSMDNAFKNNEFQVYLQPKISLIDNSLIGAEALIRWIKSDDSIIYPDMFIPFFEKCGLIYQIDLFVLETVCKLLRKWIDRGENPIHISVNVSRYDFKKSSFVNSLLEIVSKYNIPHELLEIEITESIFLDNTSALQDILNNLIELGFNVSIDDFGSGYSSLNILTEIPATILKMDRIFFCHKDTKAEQAKFLLEQLIHIAHKLGFKTICEGIETTEQADFCKSIGCNAVQGYLFSKPIPITEFENKYLYTT